MTPSPTAFTLDKWVDIAELAPLTFETRFVAVTAEEAHSFMAYCRHTQSQIVNKNKKSKMTKSMIGYEEKKEEIESDIANIKRKITEQIDDAKWNECGFFAKFNSRSPKGLESQIF